MGIHATYRKKYMKGVHSLLLLPSLFARNGPALVTLRNFHSHESSKELLLRKQPSGTSHVATEREPFENLARSSPNLDSHSL